MTSMLSTIVVCIVVALCLRQIPLDVKSRVLSRQASFIATGALVMVLASELVAIGSYRWLTVGLPSTTLIVAAYFLVHRISPSGLGFGDVLLVMPLTLAVSYGGVEPVLYWQLLAACSGALHAVVMRVWRRESSIPFGPHLLLAALVVLVASV